MALPASFAKDGFMPSSSLIPKYRRLMLSLYGPSNTGKTEFALSAPGPGMVIGMDRGLEGMLLSQNVPTSRNVGAFGFKTIPAPLATQLQQSEYLEYWKQFYNTAYKPALANPDCRTVVLDGDGDTWELQRLAEFGRLSKVPSNLYDNVNAARRVMYARAYDSGKIFIATSRVRKVYVTVYGPDGKAMLNNSGNEVRKWDGSYERQGFSDNEYMWQIHAMTLYDEAKKQFGIRLEMCKFDRSLEGFELWGDDCNFKGLVETVFPGVPLSDWGYK
jgi:hypothetical protein